MDLQDVREKSWGCKREQNTCEKLIKYNKNCLVLAESKGRAISRRVRAYLLPKVPLNAGTMLPKYLSGE